MSCLDLHMHSNISNDGEFPPKELMELCSTVGSDFHGKTKPSIRLGSVSCNNMENDIYNNILNKKVIF